MENKKCLDCEKPYSMKEFYNKNFTKPYKKYLTRCRDCRLYRRNHAYSFNPAWQGKWKPKLIAMEYMKITSYQYDHMIVKCFCGYVGKRRYMTSHRKRGLHLKNLNRVENLRLFFKTCV